MAASKPTQNRTPLLRGPPIHNTKYPTSCPGLSKKPPTHGAFSNRCTTYKIDPPTPTTWQLARGNSFGSNFDLKNWGLHNDPPNTIHRFSGVPMPVRGHAVGGLCLSVPFTHIEVPSGTPSRPLAMRTAQPSRSSEKSMVWKWRMPGWRRGKGGGMCALEGKRFSCEKTAGDEWSEQGPVATTSGGGLQIHKMKTL